MAKKKIYFGKMCIRDRHKTIFFITHSVEEAVYLGDKVVVMSGENGGIRNIVPINLERPRHVYDEAVSYTHLDVYKRQV